MSTPTRFRRLPVLRVLRASKNMPMSFKHTWLCAGLWLNNGRGFYGYRGCELQSGKVRTFGMDKKWQGGLDPVDAAIPARYASPTGAHDRPDGLYRG